MAQLRVPDPVLLVVAAFSRHDEAMACARTHLQHHFGPIALDSVPYDFVQTSYYERTMGPALRKQFFVFRDLLQPDQLADVKRTTNELEMQLAESSRWPEPRPLNLDPGILMLGKFQLATTKDQGHRVYLRDGIFAEVTLRFEAGQFVPCPWTYADYRQPLVLDFLKEARNYYRQRLQES